MPRELTTLERRVRGESVTICVIPATSFRRSRCIKRCFGTEEFVAKFANSTKATIVAQAGTKL